MNTIEYYDNAGEAWVHLSEMVLTQGIERHRGSETYKELKGIDFTIPGSNKTDAIIQKYGDPDKLKWMRNNFEILGQVSELRDANSYASRLFDYCGQKNQIDWVVSKINADKTVRSATITTLEPLTDMYYIPCISLLDFDITDGTLNLYIYSRGLDFGSKAYGNMICVADILNIVAERTNLKVGFMNFLCKSIHIYNSDYELMNTIIKDLQANL